MPLYMCSKCNCVENTALGHYWPEQFKASEEKRSPQPLCSECATGKWHRAFDKEPARGMLLGSDGFLYNKSTSAEWFAARSIKVVRTIE